MPSTASRKPRPTSKGPWKVILEIHQDRPGIARDEAGRRFWESLVLPILKTTSNNQYDKLTE